MHFLCEEAATDVATQPDLAAKNHEKEICWR